MNTGRIGYNFNNNAVTWSTGVGWNIPKTVSAKWITKLNKDDLYMEQGLTVQHKGCVYKVYLSRYETDGTWQLLPDGILFVETA